MLVYDLRLFNHNFTIISLYFQYYTLMKLNSYRALVCNLTKQKKGVIQQSSISVTNNNFLYNFFTEGIIIIHMKNMNLNAI